MDFKLSPENDPAAFRDCIDRLDAAVHLSSRLPARVFRAGYRRFQFLEFDLFPNASFWTFLKRLMDTSHDEKVTLMAMEPDIENLRGNPGHIGIIEFPISISAQQYNDGLQSAPLPPGDIFGFSAALVVFFPSSLRWIIWGERSPEIMVLALADGFPDLNTEAIAGRDVCLFTPEDALDVSTPAWRDRAARVAFAQELLSNYDNGRLYLDRPTSRALDVACNLVAEKMGVIEGCRELSSMRHAFGESLADDFRTFVAIDSETDDLPVGTVRREWNPAALVRQDIRIAECEERYKSHAIEAAERLISRLREL
jgi:hypothetical protein